MPRDKERKEDDVQLSPELMDAFVKAVEKAERRRKILFAGYLLALIVLIAGMIGAFWYAGSAPKGTFISWAFLVPLALVGLIFWIFGRWSRSAK